MTQRRGFTLIEMLIVISIIATLSALSIPAIGLIQKKVKDMRCGHQLQQIGSAIEAFKAEHDDMFPYYLCTNDPTRPELTSLTRRKDDLMADLAKMFICPRDTSNGLDSNMGRRTYKWDNLTDLHEPGCSYLYEVNGRIITDPNMKGWFLGLKWGETPPAEPLTWAQAKAKQRVKGNYINQTNLSDMTRGAPFSADRFPIIRCFHHYNWDGARDADDYTMRKVKAVSWNLNVFDCIPKWEYEIDQRFK
jgi:prepilin-type N-terminal cleavage/methylation domain-containing protein